MRNAELQAHGAQYGSGQPETAQALENSAVAEEATTVVEPQPASRQERSGHIDRLDRFTVAGWAVSPGGGPVGLQVRVNGRVIECNVSRQSRPDVRDALGIDNPEVGFEAELPGEVWDMDGGFELLGDGEPITSGMIVLDAGAATGWVADIIRMEDGPERHYLLHLAMQHVKHGKLLPHLSLSDAHFMREFAARIHYALEASGVGEAKSAKLLGKRETQLSYFDRMDKFTLVGWAIGKDDKPAGLQVRINDRSVECNIVRQQRQDVADALGIDELDTGFSIELPGYVWEDLPVEGGKIDILADGESLIDEPLELTRAIAVRWLSGIAAMGDGQEQQYLALLALEHVRYGNFLPELSAKVARFIREFAARMQLEEFLLGEDGGEGLAEKAEMPTESLSTLLLWKALRALNERMADGEPAVFERARAVIQELRLQGEVREQFIFSITPLLCKTGEFLRLRELIELGRLQQLGSAEKLWEITLALPAIIADGHIKRATDMVYLAAKSLDKGWLNTECVRYSLQLFQRMEIEGEVGIVEAEKFRYAVITLLEAFKGEWFSRLNDSNLVECMLLLLSELDRYTDYHRRDVIAAAQRVYGLNPVFWGSAADQRLVDLDSELQRGHAHFKRLHQAFIAQRGSLADWLEELAGPLAYYRAKNNPEAVIFLREICVNILPEVNGFLPVRAKALLSKLLASDSAEALRVAAFPLVAENRLLFEFPETAPEKLRETLRGLSDPDKSVAWHLQENASAALEALRGADEGDHAGAVQALSTLEQRAITLANWQGSYLAFDLLASGYVIAYAHGMECSPLLTRLLWILQKTIEETRSDWYLPTPVLAGISRLAGRAEADPLLQGFLADCRNMICGKFGERMDGVFELPERLRLPASPDGWPQDTLVVIYSCRKYLDTRVSAIRKTWVQDLKARGIPYLVLVGDGDDTITGDVLALDVSDKYEDLPKKSLKLFDWVYNNTDAQYVLKIDDDCYLDVARFFDTLSYRKHYYYGRVIKRGIGSMDRAWHKSKSHTPHGRKSIDKSPEPSVYADGGGGYVLSRLAMQRLLKAEKTQQGERLKSCSFMEDKLVGDLLAMSYIEPSNEDYDSYQRRRTFGDAMPVGMVENNFFPCLATPTKVTHLDREADLEPTHARLGSSELWPKKLWPTCWSPAIKHNSNQLELVSALDKTVSLVRNDLLVIAVVRNEMIMLPAFLSHYRGLGVKSFVMVDNCSDDGTREYLFGQPDVVLYSSDTEYRYSHYGVAWQQAVLGNLCLNKWALLVDADELLIYEGCETKPIHEFIAEVEAEGADAVRTDMIDMYPYGDLAEADFTQADPFAAAPWLDNTPLIHWKLGCGMYSNGPSLLSGLRHRLAAPAAPNAFTSQKYGLVRYRPWVRYSQGLHDVANVKVSGRRAWFAHFKYHAGFKEKVANEIRRGQHFNNAEEYRRYSMMLAEGGGGFGKDGVSVKYRGAESFAKINTIGQKG